MEKSASQLKIKIRKMEESDLRQVCVLGKQCFTGEGNEWMNFRFLKESFAQRGLNYVAEKDGKIAGGIMLAFNDMTDNCIRFLAIDEKLRGMKIGTKLLEKILSNFKKGERVFVDTGVTDRKAARFYLKHGFKKRGKIAHLYGGKFSGYVFEKIVGGLDEKAVNKHSR